MEIRENKNLCIITPICNIINGRRITRILDKIKQETRKVAIDLSYVQGCSIEFIEALGSINNKEIGIFNIPAEIFVLFNIMKMDKKLKLFVSEIDFEEEARQLINRNFSVI